MNHVLDFGRHFLSLRRDSFFKRRGFSTATGCYANNPLELRPTPRFSVTCPRVTPSIARFHGGFKIRAFPGVKKGIADISILTE
jgi:hypothetical protein